MKIFDDCWLVDQRRAEIIPTHGRKSEISEGISLFDEPSLQFQSLMGEIPSELLGESFLYTKLGAELGFTVKKAGWVLIIGENDPFVDSWQYLRFILTRAPGRGGFTAVADMEENELLPHFGRPLTLYAGWCEEGYSFQGVIQRGQTAIVIANVPPEYIPIQYAEATENNKEISLYRLDALFGDKLKQEDYYLPENRGYQACPAVAVTEKGSIYVGFMATPFGFTGTGGENHYGYVSLVRSRDGGITWEDPIAVFDPDKEGPCRTFEPVLWTSPDRKRLYLFYTQSAGLENNLGGALGTWVSYCDDPESDTPHFSQPIRAFDGFTDSAARLFSDGYWYVAPAFSRCLTPECFDMSKEGHEIGVHLYRSKDCLNWEHVCHLPNTCDHISEPSIIELPDGRILLEERTPSGTHYLWSDIKDPTLWSNPEPLCFDNNKKDLIMNPADTRNSIRLLPSGNILYLFNNSREPKRELLSAALSEDGGKTFPYVILLDERIGSTYPMADITVEGDIFIVYDQGRSRLDKASGSEILFARITEQDIIKGELVSPRSCIKRLVTRYGLAPREDSFKAILDRLPLEVAEEYKDRRSLEDYVELCRKFDKN